MPRRVPPTRGNQLTMPPSRSSQRSNPFADPNPGGDGWRTPTIEDAHHPRNLELRRTHTSGLTEKSQQTDYFNGVHQRRADSRATASTHASAVDHVEPGEDGASIVPSEENMHLSIRQRLKHVTWAWFTLVMATGGVASTLHAGKCSCTFAALGPDDKQYPSASLACGRLVLFSSWPTLRSMLSSGP